MLFADWVAQYPDVNRTILANRALTDHSELLVEVVARAIDHIRRAGVRAEESGLTTAFLQAMRTTLASAVPVSAPNLEEFYRLLRERFALGDGTRVTWGQATIAQHEQRVAMLQQIVRGTEETIARHEAAIQYLRAERAACLDDLLSTSVPAGSNPVGGTN